jgi:hypothetical protein
MSGWCVASGVDPPWIRRGSAVDARATAPVFVPSEKLLPVA